ncbi:hypothetical protein GPS63_08925 [Acinetobacter haemolyticus]|uniref:Uncharacterized protein n=2 Tax=Acinetobacter TaxID=469 RepID=A0A150HNZ5_9GAMM|nr:MULTISPECIES: hypothetical protein [Acinetobacter]ENW21881.1 hypothetical protein F926_01175 [Acinetobacter haemolyticus NIPH 261]ENW96030.1 hypothetical protein F903_01799 [Acinetobacter sp. NIPH 298]KXZ68074.1 hypothetical protein AVENLUH5627_01926 [Acinetobacter venetianus]MDA3508427.1 hypothetical protein [Acinetobacter junii]MDA3532949.1 hypothetical protein [Acinetobacter junii]
MAYVNRNELFVFVFEVYQGFLNYCTKSTYEHDVEAPNRDDLNLAYLQDIRRNFNEEESQRIVELMEQPISVKRNGKMYSSHDFLEVLRLILELIEQFDELSDKEIKKAYKEIISQYAEMDVDILFSKKIHTRIRGVRGANKRYQKSLYKKHQVIFDFMLNKAQTQGKWDNLNTAVDSVLPELDLVLKQFDKKWIETQLEEKMKLLAELQREFEKYKVNPPSNKIGSGIIITATREQTFINKIRELQVTCRELQNALQMDDPSILLKKKLPFNTAYQPEVIKNLLRRHEDLLSQIIGPE